MPSDELILQQIDESLRVAGQVLPHPSDAEDVVVRCLALYLSVVSRGQSDAHSRSNLRRLVQVVLEEAKDLSQRLEELPHEPCEMEECDGPQSRTVLKKARKKVDDLRRSTLPPAFS